MGSAEFVAYSKAYVKTGIDLSELKKEDVIIEGKSITLKLPHVRIIDFRYPFDEFEIDYIYLSERLDKKNICDRGKCVPDGILQLPSYSGNSVIAMYENHPQLELIMRNGNSAIFRVL